MNSFCDTTVGVVRCAIPAFFPHLETLPCHPVNNKGMRFSHRGLMLHGGTPSPRILMNILVAIAKPLLIALSIPANLSE